MNDIADELTVVKHKIDGGQAIGVCPNCPHGVMFIIDEIEKICFCPECGNEMKYGKI